MEIYRKLRRLLTPSERRQMLILLNMMVIGMLLETLGLGLVTASISLMAQPNLLEKYTVLQPILHVIRHERVIMGWMLILVSIYLIKTAFLASMIWYRNKFIFTIQASLSHRLFKGYLEQPWTFHLQRNSAQLIHNSMYETGFFSTVALQSGLILLSEGLVLLGICATLLYIQPVLTMVTVGISGLVISSFYQFFRKKLTQWGKIRQQYDEHRLKYLQQGLGGVKEAKLLGREDDFISLFSRENSASLNISQKLGTLSEMPRLVLELILIFSLTSLLALMVIQGKSIEVIVSTAGLFAAAAFRLMPSANRILGAIQSLRYSYPSLQTLYDESRLIKQSSKDANKIPIQFKNVITLDRISYQYPQTHNYALKDVSLQIVQGSIVGFIGKSGGGKSTLIDLILGLLLPNSGKICIDGIDIQDNLREWQNQIGYVSQSIFLTDDTLRRNIAFGLPEEKIDEAAVWKAIKLAQLEEFVEHLSDGINTLVGERGVRLSGGQRQRIGIARALYHDPKVVVLDEATSSLDMATESEIMKDINKLKGEKTLVIIAHRLSTLVECDHIYHLEQGKIIESGSFQEVIERNKTLHDYHKNWQPVSLVAEH
jgi:ABC-type multidrug transport system fused ATPase/permease subunit